MMNPIIHLTVQVNFSWEVVRRVREKVERALAMYAEEIRSAAVLTASELIENAVKYGVTLDQHSDILFDLQVTDQAITITVANHVAVMKNCDIARQRIDQIQSAPNLRELYIQQLQDLLEERGEAHTGLGLYRIAYEGQFTLQYALEQDVVTVTARRKLPS